MNSEIIINSINELPQVAKQILLWSHGRKVFAFYGEMGAGKTAIIKVICHELGTDEKVVSPTFAIVNEYSGKEKIIHMDLYRLNSLTEAINIGIEEYLESGNYIFIEWPELIEDILPATTVKVSIRSFSSGQRSLKVE